MSLPHLIPCLGQLAFIAFLPITSLILLVSYCYKFVITKCATLFRKELIEPLPPSSMFYASDDTATNPWFMVTGIFTFKGVPVRQRVFQDFEKLFDTRSAQDNTLIYWKLQSHIVKWMGYFWWKQDTHFSLINHIQFIEGDVSSFQKTSKFVDGLVRKPFGANRPLWDVTIISNEDNATSVMIFRFGHIVMDGFTFLKLYNRLGGFGNLTSDVPLVRSKANPFIQKMKMFAVGTFLGVYEYLKFVENYQYVNSACKFTDQKIKTGEWVCGLVPGINLSQFNQARKILKCSFFDLLLAGFLGGARKFLERKGEFPDKMNFGVPLPKPNHPSEFVTNHFFLTIMRLPLNITNLEERVKATAKASKSGRLSPLVGFLEFVCEALSTLPIANFANEVINFHGFSGFASFVPAGEKFPGLFGLETQTIRFCIPPGKLATITCGGLTGNNKIWFSLTADRGPANDPTDMEYFAECVHEEFQDIFRLTNPPAKASLRELD